MSAEARAELRRQVVAAADALRTQAAALNELRGWAASLDQYTVPRTLSIAVTNAETAALWATHAAAQVSA